MNKKQEQNLPLVYVLYHIRPSLILLRFWRNTVIDQSISNSLSRELMPDANQCARTSTGVRSTGVNKEPYYLYQMRTMPLACRPSIMGQLASTSTEMELG